MNSNPPCQPTMTATTPTKESYQAICDAVLPYLPPLKYRFKLTLWVVMTLVCWATIVAQMSTTTTLMSTILQLSSSSSYVASSLSLLQSRQTIPLDELVHNSYSTTSHCPKGQVRLDNLLGLSKEHSKERTNGDAIITNQKMISTIATTSNDTKPNTTTASGIPRIIHVWSESGYCVARPIAQAIQSHYRNHAKKEKKKTTPNTSPPSLPLVQIYLHNPAAMNRLLFQRQWREFPIFRAVWKGCSSSFSSLLSPLSSRELVDLWQVLVVWEYGGLALQDINHLVSLLELYQKKDEKQQEQQQQQQQQQHDKPTDDDPFWAIFQNHQPLSDDQDHHQQAIVTVSPYAASSSSNDPVVWVWNPMGGVAAEPKHPLVYVWVLQYWKRHFTSPDVEYDIYHAPTESAWAFQQAMNRYSVLPQPPNANNLTQSQPQPKKEQKSYQDLFGKAPPASIPPGQYIGLDHGTVTVREAPLAMSSSSWSTGAAAVRPSPTNGDIVAPPRQSSISCSIRLYQMIAARENLRNGGS